MGECFIAGQLCALLCGSGKHSFALVETELPTENAEQSATLNIFFMNFSPLAFFFNVALRRRLMNRVLQITKAGECSRIVTEMNRPLGMAKKKQR